MYMIRFKVNGSYQKAFTWMERLLQYFKKGGLNKFGERGVEALRAATPKDTGKTADSWDYNITYGNGRASIVWTNDNIVYTRRKAIWDIYDLCNRRSGKDEFRRYINNCNKC